MSTFDKLASKGIFYQPLDDGKAAAPDKKKSEQGDFSRGVEKSMRQIPQTAGGAVALVGDLVGSQGMVDYGLGIYDNQSEKIAEITRDSDSMSNVMEDKGDANLTDWVQHNAGYVGGQLVTAAATGGLGGMIGKQLAQRGIKEVVARGAKSAAAKAVAEKVATRGAMAGAATGLFGHNLVQEAGSIYPEAVEQAHLEGRELDGGDKARVVGSALAAAGVETGMDVLMAGRLLNGARKPLMDAAGKPLRNEAGEVMYEGMARAGLREIPGGMARESVTEGIQTGIERYGAGKELGTADAIREYVDSMSVGALGGGMGGGLAVLQKQKVAESGPLSRAANVSIDNQILQLAHDPQPLISFPDGSVGYKQDLEAYLTQYPEGEERERRRREIMGRDPETGKRIQVEEPTSADNAKNEAATMQAWGQKHDGVPLDYAQSLVRSPGAKGKDLMVAPHPSGKLFTVVPSKWLTLDSQARFSALQKGDAAMLPGPDREAPGGAIRVDSEGGAAPETYGEQGRTAQRKRDEETADKLIAQRELDLGTSHPHGPRQEKKAGGPIPTLTDIIQPGTLLNPKGEPFKTEFAAKKRAKDEGVNESHTVMPVEGGFVLQPNDGIPVLTDVIGHKDDIPVLTDEIGKADEIPVLTDVLAPPDGIPVLTDRIEGQPDIPTLTDVIEPGQDGKETGTAPAEDLPAGPEAAPEAAPAGKQLEFRGVHYRQNGDAWELSRDRATWGKIRSAPAIAALERGEDPNPTGKRVTPPADRGAEPDPLAEAAHEAATSPTNDLPEPTQAQKEAGNYKVGRVKVHGLDIAIENPAGSTRSGVDRDGKKWENTLAHHYGYINRTTGADGDHVDAFIGPKPDSDRVFIVNQVDPKTGRFDEHKVIFGAESLDEAREIYQANYEKGWQGGKDIVETSAKGFKAWLTAGATHRPFVARKPNAAYDAAQQHRRRQDDVVAEAAANLAQRQAGESATEGAETASDAGKSASKDTETASETGKSATDAGNTATGPSWIRKQIPGMSDAELAEAIEYYGPDHKRTPKLRKALEHRAAKAEPAPAAPAPAAPAAEAGAPKVKTTKRQKGLTWEVRDDKYSVLGHFSIERGQLKINPFGDAQHRAVVQAEADRVYAEWQKEQEQRIVADELVDDGKPAQLENGTAPEHVVIGVDDRELGEIVEEFNAAQAEMMSGEHVVTNIFQPPKKGEVVRLEKKAGVTSKVVKLPGEKKGTRVYNRAAGWMTPAEAREHVEAWKAHAQAQGENQRQRSENSQRVVLSLFDLSGEWSRPWEEAGYQVYRFDIQDDPEVGDVNNFSAGFFGDWFGDFEGMDVYAILAACPCTDFAVSGAKHFAAKDNDGRTVASVKLVHQTLRTIEYFKPQVWALENPVGRIEDLGGLPPWRLAFNPFELGDPYTKKTLIWGRFNADLPIAPVEPTEGSKMFKKYGGKSMATKNARSVTPEGFSYGFFMANNAIDHPVMALANKFDRLDRGLIEQALNAGIKARDIESAVEDLYYGELDDDGANQAIRDLIAEVEPPKPTNPTKPKALQERDKKAAVKKAAEPKPAPAEQAPAPKQEAPGTRINGATERAAADRLESLLGQMPATMKPRAQSARGYVKSVVEQLRREKTVVSIVENLETASQRFLSDGHAPFSEVIDEVIESLQATPAPAQEQPYVYEGKGGRVIDLEKMHRRNLQENRQSIGADVVGEEQAGMFAQAALRDARAAFDADGKYIGKNKYRVVPTHSKGSIYEFTDLAAAKEHADTYGQRDPSAPKAEKRKRLGRGNRDQVIFENAAGVRSYTESGFKYTEEPGKPREAEFKTLAELSQEQAAPAAADRFAGNKLFTSDAVEKARARMKSKLGTLNSGIDPELLMDGITIAGAYIEAGVRSFGEYSAAMLADLGDGVRPYLRSFYEGVRHYPGLDTKGMSTAAEIDALEQAGTAPHTKPTEAKNEAIGTTVKAKPTKAKTPANPSLRLDWGVDHIDGYTEIPGGANEQTDYGLRGGVKDAFLKDAETYLKAVAKQLEGQGFAARATRKGKAVSVNEAGPAVAGDVYLNMLNEELGHGIMITVGASGMRGLTPTSRSGVSVMMRATGAEDKTTSTYMNNWMPVDLTASDLADKAADLVRGTAAHAARAVAKAATPSNTEPAPAPAPTTTEDTTDDSTPSTSTDSLDSAVDQGQRPAGSEANARRGEQPRARPGRADGDGIRGTRGPAESADDAGRDLGDGSRADRVSDGKDAAVAGSNGPVHADFIPAVGGLTREGSWFDTAKRNIDLIDLARKIESEGRPATAEEQAQLSKYVGFGAGAIRNKLFPIPSVYAKQADPQRLIWPNMIQEASWRALAERMDALPREWQKSVLQSSQYAHYTSEGIIRSVWSGLQRLGFTGGKIMEPGMGIGSFSMLMPGAVRSTSRYTGVEFDGPTALIARLLSPEQNMLHDDFIKRKLPRDYFDVAIGNPPFSQTRIFGDPDYEKHGFMLHDFFFAKSIDRVRPGGLLAFVTSKGTMDKQNDKARTYLAKRADLVGAIRLPSTAFEDNAGTSVVTDVIFLRKRLEDEAPAGEAWAGVATVETKDGPVVINEYFAKHPEMVLGQNRISGNTDDHGRRINSNGRGGEQYTVVSYDRTPAELDAKFAAAIERLPQNVYSVMSQSPASLRREVAKVDFDPSVKREGVVYIGAGGEIMRVENGVGVPLSQGMKMQKADAAWFKGYIGLRDLVNEARLAQATDGNWEKALKALNKAYDAFRKEHGPINDFRVQKRKSTDEEGNPVETEIRIFTNRRRFREDYDAAILTQLETINEAGEIVKSPFLNGRTIGKPVARSVQTVGDALAVSLDEIGRLDLDDVGRRIGLSRDEAINALGDQVYKTPAGQWQLADEYLSGDVVAKLDEAELAAMDDRSLDRNVAALKAVQPEKLGPSQISAKLGASWIPVAHVNEFAKEIGAGAVTFDHQTESWQVDGGNLRSQRRAGAEYGTAARSPSELLEAALNSRSVKITSKTTDGKTVVDEEATTAAAEMLKKIKDKFKGWVWTDSERGTELVESYNRRFNNIAPRRFDGSHLTLPGVSMRYKLHPHQKRAIWRIIQTGDTYLNHAVGAGKTIEMIAAGMEQKRLGLIKKPMYVVPNHMLEQFANEFMELYPLANIMVADDENFSAERRKAFIASATMNNPDAVIITHDAFQRIGVKEESVAPIRDEILADLEIELASAEKDSGARVRRSQLEQQIEAVTQRFDRIISAGGKDSTIKFEDIGVDFVFADEAHVFRKLDFHTSQQIKGIDPNGSKRALDMYVKTRWLQTQRPGRSMVFASGTPVTNTMGELYTIMRFFSPDELDRAGISTFDAWARQFGEVAPALEPNAAGKYELIERFAKFDNVPELMSRVRQFMDVLTSEHLGALVKRPDLKGGKPNLNIVQASEDLTDYMKSHLGPRIERSKKWKPSKDEPNNPDPIVAIITDGRFAAIDPRFFGGELGEEGSIITHMGDKVIANYHAGKDNVYLDKNDKPEPIKGSTQIVFYNLGFGEQSQKARGFSSRDAFTKHLIAGGVKREHIAWFDDADTDAKKEAVFKDMRSGKLRILIGSAKKMGTGVNVQKRLAVLHYQDPPWFPADVEQPHGRIIRQGNQNGEVAIEWYTTKGTYQSTMWQMVARKQRFIDQAFSGDKNLRSMEDMGEASLFEQAAAVASGDPRAIQLAGLKQDVERFERLQAAHASEQINVRSALRGAEGQVRRAKSEIAEYSAAFKVIGERFYSFTTGKVGNQVFDKVGELGQAVKDLFNQKIAWVAAGKKVQELQIGTLGDNLPISVDMETNTRNEPTGELTLYVHVGETALQVAQGKGMGADVDAVGLGRRIVNQVNSISTNLDRAKRELTTGETDIVRLTKKMGAPFEYQQEMAEKYAELKRLEAELKAEGEKVEAPAIAITEDGTMAGETSTTPPDDTLRASVFYADKTIEVDGQRRPLVDSNGNLVAPDFARQMEFWRNFAGELDDKGRPIVAGDVRASTSTGAGIDDLVMKAAAGGATVDKLLGMIERQSKRPELRTLARALRNIGLKTNVRTGAPTGTYTAGVRASEATASYRQSDDTAFLHQQEGAEQALLHELVHAATLRGLQRGGLGATQVKALWRHVKDLPNFADQYGIRNEEEFIAEAFTNPQFRQKLADTPAPGAKLSLWQKLVAIVRILLGKPAITDNTLEAVMEAGGRLMGEDRAARNGEPAPAAGLRASAKPWERAAQLEWERGTADMVTAYLPDGTTLHIYMDEEGAELSHLDENGNDLNSSQHPDMDAAKEAAQKQYEKINAEMNGTLRASIAQSFGAGLKAATLGDLFGKIGNRLKDFRGLGLQTLGRRQLVDLYAPDFAPAGKESLLRRYSDLMQQMDADKNEAGAEADGIADRWGKLADADKLADLMHDATLAKIDPAKAHQAGDNRAEWAALERRYKALSPEAQKIYREARDAYRAHWVKVRTEIRNRIQRAMPESPRRAALLEKMDATFFEQIQGVYFPLARFGDYVVTVTNAAGERQSVNFAETMNEAEQLRAELVKKFPAGRGFKVSKITKKREFNAGRDSVSRGFMQELFGVLDQYEDSAELQDDINQLYLQSMPDLSWAKHGIHRKGTPGFSQDARRAFAQNMFHGARYLAKLRYGDRLANFLDEMQDHVTGKADDAGYDSVKAQQVVDEMVKRHDAYMSPNSNPLSTALTSIGFVFYLGLSPASAAVNLSQTPLVTLPMLAAKYGFGKASAALLDASKLAAANKNDISKGLTGDELAAYNEAIAAGVIDVSMAHDLAGIAAGDDAKTHAKLRPVMKWASWMFHHGEKFNRQATLLAAYRLARGAGKDHAGAYKAAVDEVYASHFDYSSGNRARVMQGNVARVALLFKQYAQNMIYTLSRNAVLAAKGDPVARKTLAGLLLSHALAAGVLGLPIVGQLLAAATLIGSDDDEPWDAKVALRNYLADVLGQKPAEVLMHGVSRLTPVDISGRVGLDKLILPDVQEGLEGSRAAEAWLSAALGPVAGIGVSGAKGMASIAEGDYLRGLENMLPVALRNPVKALRYHQDGAKDKTGIPIVDDTSELEELGQLVGFSPARVREATEGKGAVYRAERQLNDRRQALVEQWAHARMAGDDEGAAEVREAIQRFNEKNPGRRITMPQLVQSLRNRNKRIQQAEGGVYLPRKHQDVRELGRFAEQEE